MNATNTFKNRVYYMYSNHLLLVGRTEVPSGKPFYNYSRPLFFFFSMRRPAD